MAAPASREHETKGSTMVFGDPFTEQLLALASRVARTEVTVLIGGSSGTGKEVLARVIHDQSLRRSGPFVAFNCACLPESMVEDLLFGHEKGAFTGAVQRFEGFFEQADGGTLFLDEVGEMPLSVQAKLLRVLQEREFTPLGSCRAQATRFRLLAATNRDLKAEVQAGRFREDLYYRLNIFPLQIKPLRDRPGDIVPLARALIRRHSYIAGERQLDPGAIAALHNYGWPGNVRELENVIQRALVVSDGPALTAANLELDPGTPSPAFATGMAWDAESPRSGALDTAPAHDDVDRADAAPTPELSLADRRAMQEAELILATLKSTPTKTVAAARLGISERTLRYKMARLREHGIMEAGA
jgi:two-component system response regulator FlrC